MKQKLVIMIKKHFIALFSLICACTSTSLYANDIIIEINEIKENVNSHNGGARNILPSVIVSLCDSDLQIQFEWYDGNVTASIYNESLEEIVTESSLVHNKSQIIIDLSSCSSGSYILRLFIGDTIFEGLFVL